MRCTFGIGILWHERGGCPLIRYSAKYFRWGLNSRCFAKQISIPYLKNKISTEPSIYNTRVRESVIFPRLVLLPWGLHPREKHGFNVPYLNVKAILRKNYRWFSLWKKPFWPIGQKNRDYAFGTASLCSIFHPLFEWVIKNLCKKKPSTPWQEPVA